MLRGILTKEKKTLTEKKNLVFFYRKVKDELNKCNTNFKNHNTLFL